MSIVKDPGSKIEEIPVEQRCECNDFFEDPNDGCNIHGREVVPAYGQFKTDLKEVAWLCHDCFSDYIQMGIKLERLS